MNLTELTQVLYSIWGPASIKPKTITLYRAQNIGKTCLTYNNLLLYLHLLQLYPTPTEAR